MSDTPPYSEATVELVAKVVADERGCFSEVIAERILDALAAAGRLLPEGAETQWGLRRHDRESVAPYASREVAERWQGVSQPGWHLVSRPVGPWSAVPPEPKEGT